MAFQIAIDGPAGAGKSTVAKGIAKKLGFIYVDTGAMYRALGLFFLRRQISADDENTINENIDQADVQLLLEDGIQHVLLNGEDVSTAIRTEKAGMTASKISTYLKVREKLVAAQQKIAGEQNVVMDGRDIGTVVLPGAQLKIFLTASVEERARRRYAELEPKGVKADIREIEEDIKKRDYQDTHREHSPLRQAEDAVLVDTTEIDADGVIEKIVQLAEERMTDGE